MLHTKKMKLKMMIASCAAMLAQILTASSAIADVVYLYIGNQFTSVSGTYTKNDKVTGHLVLPVLLGSNLDLQAVTPLSFLFSDGVQILTPTNTEDNRFEFSTTASGEITAWQVQVNGNTYGIRTSTVPSNEQGAGDDGN